MLDRRAFLKRLVPAAAGIVVAPTLAETLYHGAKKYFFLNGNPLASWEPEKFIDGFQVIPIPSQGLNTWADFAASPMYFISRYEVIIDAREIKNTFAQFKENLRPFINPRLNAVVTGIEPPKVTSDATFD